MLKISSCAFPKFTEYRSFYKMNCMIQCCPLVLYGRQAVVIIRRCLGYFENKIKYFTYISFLYIQKFLAK